MNISRGSVRRRTREYKSFLCDRCCAFAGRAIPSPRKKVLLGVHSTTRGSAQCYTMSRMNAVNRRVTSGKTGRNRILLHVGIFRTAHSLTRSKSRTLHPRNLSQQILATLNIRVDLQVGHDCSQSYLARPTRV